MSLCGASHRALGTDHSRVSDSVNSQPESHKVKLQRQAPHAAAAAEQASLVYPVSSCLVLSPRPAAHTPQLTSCPSFRPQLRSHLSMKTSRLWLFQCFNNQALGLHLKQYHALCECSLTYHRPAVSLYTLFPDEKTKVQRYQATKVATAGDPEPLGTKAVPFTTQPLLGLAVPVGAERTTNVHACLL